MLTKNLITTINVDPPATAHWKQVLRWRSLRARLGKGPGHGVLDQLMSDASLRFAFGFDGVDDRLNRDWLTVLILSLLIVIFGILGRIVIEVDAAPGFLALLRLSSWLPRCLP